MKTGVLVAILVFYCLCRRKDQLPTVFRYIKEAVKAVRDAWRNM